MILHPRMYYTSNPGNVGHAWFKRLFVDRDFRGAENPDDYEFIQATVFDNKVLMEKNPGVCGKSKKRCRKVCGEPICTGNGTYWREGILQSSTQKSTLCVHFQFQIVGRDM